MSRLLIPTLFLLVGVLSGCGSGGGSTSSPINEARQASGQANTALVNGDLEGYMSLVSDHFDDGLGTTKDMIRENLNILIKAFVVESLTFEYDNFSSRPDGSVVESFRGRLVVRTRTGNQRYGLSLSGENIWAREATRWKMIDSSSIIDLVTSQSFRPL